MIFPIPAQNMVNKSTPKGKVMTTTIQGYGFCVNLRVPPASCEQELEVEMEEKRLGIGLI